MMNNAAGNAAAVEPITEILPNDVLLGRGALSIVNEGNIRFRSLAKHHQAQYVSTSRRKKKDKIAKAIRSEVERRTGRFIRRVESDIEKQRLGLPFGVKVWVKADEGSVIRKIKQALREQDSDGEEEALEVLPPQDDSLVHADAKPRAEKRVKVSDVLDEKARGNQTAIETRTLGVSNLGDQPTSHLHPDGVAVAAVQQPVRCQQEVEQLSFRQENLQELSYPRSLTQQYRASQMPAVLSLQPQQYQPLPFLPERETQMSSLFLQQQQHQAMPSLRHSHLVDSDWNTRLLERLELERIAAALELRAYRERRLLMMQVEQDRLINLRRFRQQSALLDDLRRADAQSYANEPPPGPFNLSIGSPTHSVAAAANNPREQTSDHPTSAFRLQRSLEGFQGHETKKSADDDSK